jgi:hypothetical protein
MTLSRKNIEWGVAGLELSAAQDVMVDSDWDLPADVRDTDLPADVVDDQPGQIGPQVSGGGVDEDPYQFTCTCKKRCMMKLTAADARVLLDMRLSLQSMKSLDKSLQVTLRASTS